MINESNEQQNSAVNFSSEQAEKSKPTENTEKTNAGKQSFGKNVLLNTFYQILLIIAPLLTAPYVSRVLHADGLGIYSYTHSLVMYFVMFAGLGTVSYGVREIARRRHDCAEYSKTFWEIELITVITSVICLAVWILFASLYTEYRVYLLILSIYVISVIFDISWLYSGLELYKYTVFVNSLFKILGVVATFVFVKNQNDVKTYILIQALTVIGGNLSMWIFLPKVLKKSKIDFKNLWNHFKGTLVFFVPAIATSMYTVLDKTLIGALIPGVREVMENGVLITKKISELENGYYEQATKLLNLVSNVCFIGIVGVATSRSSFLYAQKKEGEMKTLLNDTFNITSFLCIGAGCGLAATAATFIPIFFGDGYEASINIVYILCFISFIISVSNVLGGIYYTPSGRRKQSTVYLLIGAAINVVLNIPLILLFRAYGAAVASIVSEIVISILYLVNCKGILTFRNIFKIVWKKLVAGILMLAVGIALSVLLKDVINKYVLLAIQLLSEMAVYLIVLLCLKDNSIRECLGFLKIKKDKHRI